MTSNTNQDTILFEMLRQARPMIYNFAEKYHLEAEDLMQEAAVFLLELIPRMPVMDRPYAYLQRAIRLHFYGMLRARKQTPLSLDMPLSSETSNTLADLLPAAEPVVHDELREDRRQQALYDALRALWLDEQSYLREVYELNAYNPVPPCWPYKATGERSRSQVSGRAFRALRKNAKLKRAICYA